jgi:Fibronectin type III domain
MPKRDGRAGAQAIDVRLESTAGRVAEVGEPQPKPVYLVTNYLIERCTGANCSSFAQVGTSATLSFSDSGLTGATTYRYQVRATDAAANLSGDSPIASATTQTPSDTQPPTAPAALTATATSATTIALTWTAATDNVGVTSYLIERCSSAGCTSFGQIGTATTPSFSDSGLTGATTYRYQVRAMDAAANLSGYSTITGATTPSVISFVQANAGQPQATQTVVTIPFAAAQTAGNLNIVIVSWNDSVAQIQSVTDTSGNAYALAVGPTIDAGVASQSIYQATSIAAAAANAVTVTFSSQAAYPDIRIAEYAGVRSTSPVDATAAAQGSSALGDSGTLTTTNGNDLLVAASITQVARAERRDACDSGNTSRDGAGPASDAASEQRRIGR